LFVATRRTKEIAIRKTLGATSFDIVQLLLWHFSKPVLLANLIAWPAAFVLAQEWLAGFEYRISINPLIFITASVVALMIAWLTVGIHTGRVAGTKPGLVLHYE
jgi:putative ABC transport system permease protein